MNELNKELMKEFTEDELLDVELKNKIINDKFEEKNSNNLLEEDLLENELLSNKSNDIVRLVIDNVYITIFNIEKDVELMIWDKLSFEVQEFGQQFPRRRHLYNRKTKKTYTGLLNYIIEILQEQNIEYQIEDTRIAWESNADFKLVEFLDEEKTIPLTFRPYQKDIVNRASNRETIQAATGEI